MPWGSYLHTGTVTVKGRTESVSGWRDTSARPVPAAIDEAGRNHVRARIRDLTIVASRPTRPPACHTETPGA